MIVRASNSGSESAKSETLRTYQIQLIQCTPIFSDSRSEEDEIDGPQLLRIESEVVRVLGYVDAYSREQARDIFRSTLADSRELVHIQAPIPFPARKYIDAIVKVDQWATVKRCEITGEYKQPVYQRDLDVNSFEWQDPWDYSLP